MNKHMNVRAIAKIAGVSPATVSRYLNGKVYVSIESKARIKRAIEQLTEKAQDGKLRIALCSLADKLAYDFYSETLQEIWQLGQASGADMRLVSMREDEAQSVGQLASMGGRPDCIVCVGGAISSTMIDALCDTGVSVILVDNYHDRAHSVNVDNKKGIERAISYLNELGHRDIAFVGASYRQFSHAQRYEGYLKAMKERGVEPLSAFYRGGDFYAEGDAMMEEIIRSGKHFSAVVAGGDMMTRGALSALSRYGISVPQEVSVIGFGLRSSEQRNVGGVTGVSLMPQEIAVYATEFIGFITRNHVRNPIRTYIMPELVLSTTCAPVRIDQ